LLTTISVKSATEIQEATQSFIFLTNDTQLFFIHDFRTFPRFHGWTEVTQNSAV